MKKIRAVCIYCKFEWDDEIDVPKNYKHGMSICEKCIKDRELENMFDGSSKPIIGHNMDPDEFQLYSDLTKRDSDKFRGCKCNWCSKKSVVRIRRYNMDGDLRKVTVIASCDKHVKKLKKIAALLT